MRVTLLQGTLLWQQRSPARSRRQSRLRCCSVFFAVTRARPDDKEVERTQSDEEISDQDLDLEGHDLEQLLQTTPGGRKGTRKRKADDYHENAVAAIAYARDRWKISTSQARKGQLTALPISVLSLKEMISGAAALRRAGEEYRSVQGLSKLQMRARLKSTKGCRGRPSRNGCTRILKGLT